MQDIWTTMFPKIAMRSNEEEPCNDNVLFIVAEALLLKDFKDCVGVVSW
jgi:hypothetical protein